MPRLCFQLTILSTIDSWESGGRLNQGDQTWPKLTRTPQDQARLRPLAIRRATARRHPLGSRQAHPAQDRPRGRRCCSFRAARARARDRTMAPKGRLNLPFERGARIEPLAPPRRWVKPISSSAALSGSRPRESRWKAPRPPSRAPVWLQATPSPPPLAQALGRGRRPAWRRPAQGPS
jgi:hypothetical protein